MYASKCLYASECLNGLCRSVLKNTQSLSLCLSLSLSSTELLGSHETKRTGINRFADSSSIHIFQQLGNWKKVGYQTLSTNSMQSDAQFF